MSLSLALAVRLVCCNKRSMSWRATLNPLKTGATHCQYLFMLHERNAIQVVLIGCLTFNSASSQWFISDSTSVTLSIKADLLTDSNWFVRVVTLLHAADLLTLSHHFCSSIASWVGMGCHLLLAWSFIFPLNYLLIWKTLDCLFTVWHPLDRAWNFV